MDCIYNFNNACTCSLCYHTMMFMNTNFFLFLEKTWTLKDHLPTPKEDRNIGRRKGGLRTAGR